MNRTYLDHNATTPLRAEARAAMVAAMDVVGNPSSVHAEGRAANALVERARGQVAQAVGCLPQEVVFTSGATEAANLVFSQDWDVTACSPLEHDAVFSCADEVIREDIYAGSSTSLLDKSGVFTGEFVSGFGLSAKVLQKGDKGYPRIARGLFALTAANSETGVVQPYSKVFREFVGEFEISHRFCDATQAFGKIPFAFNWSQCEYACVSAHKIGGPKGIGALIVKQGTEIAAALMGGGQEMGRRSGTENVIGIAGFGAAAEAAARDLDAGLWGRVEKLRNILEKSLAAEANATIFVGKDARRLPNTSCFAVPGWKGETQVMQMDLAGFAVSAGSACSSGKVRESRVLRAMGYEADVARCAIRVSLGLETTEDDVLRFAEAWLAQYRKFRARAA
ncbi:aminotransferase [Actibacterium mucosum KCTC 23349]|uniref:Cysteine desulfurase n=1 Tax=Actibacterium mucosum KCTC 23349 TaxID=1454373 RepID=A0A037ZIE4_9RHOB|nr:aminotransferase class V-fold PLP-dependent enzyme [Actibacterium mucosum]KAJ55374.1 aminotransferase [Actibacterium mucosum KCTC 23349]